MRRFARDNSLSLVFGGLFIVSLVGQAIAGHAKYNNDELAHAQLMHQQPELLSFGRYVVSSQFGQAVMENWQSEFLQFTLLILATVWLVQKGSPESKPVDKAGTESDEDQLVGEHAQPDSPLWARVTGLRRRLYENSLVLVMGLFFFGSWGAHSVTGWSAYNAEQLEHREKPVSWLGFVTSSDFWETTLQNWQSEFLAVGSMTVMSIYLRQRGSPESKPVGMRHEATGVGG
jgi:uncharacterized protein DUF6766